MHSYRLVKTGGTYSYNWTSVKLYFWRTVNIDLELTLAVFLHLVCLINANRVVAVQLLYLL